MRYSATTRLLKRSDAGQTAEKIFTVEVRDMGAPFVEKIWRTQSEPFDGASA